MYTAQCLAHTMNSISNYGMIQEKLENTDKGQLGGSVS